jgi:hypothetical protein
MQQAFLHNLTSAHGHFEIISLEKGQEVYRSPVIPNRILDAGLALIAQHHAGNDSNALEITSLEIGSGSTAVAGGDTALDTVELTGVVPSRTTPSGASIVVEFFLVDAELSNGTYRELGLRAGTTLYTRALFTTPYVKVAGRDTIIRYTLSYSAV